CHFLLTFSLLPVSLAFWLLCLLCLETLPLSLSLSVPVFYAHSKLWNSHPLVCACLAYFDKRPVAIPPSRHSGSPHTMDCSPCRDSDLAKIFETSPNPAPRSAKRGTPTTDHPPQPITAFGQFFPHSTPPPISHITNQ
ncbi:hypothetical protein LZ30DRAFT_210240, partial [Colletotrichum cereale]